METKVPIVIKYNISQKYCQKMILNNIKVIVEAAG